MSCSLMHFGKQAHAPSRTGRTDARTAHTYYLFRWWRTTTRFFIHISLVLTPIRPLFEPTTLSLSSLQEYKLKRDLRCFFNYSIQPLMKAKKFQWGPFFLVSPPISLFLVVKLSPHSRDLVPHLKTPQNRMVLPQPTWNGYAKCPTT